MHAHSLGNDQWKPNGTAKNFVIIKADTKHEHSAAVKSTAHLNGCKSHIFIVVFLIMFHNFFFGSNSLLTVEMRTTTNFINAEIFKQTSLRTPNKLVKKSAYEYLSQSPAGVPWLSTRGHSTRSFKIK